MLQNTMMDQQLLWWLQDTFSKVSWRNLEIILKYFLTEKLKKHQKQGAYGKL
jgi:hypothetical protein